MTERLSRTMEETYRGIWVNAYRELLRFVNETEWLFFFLIMPFLLLAVFGAGFNRIVGELAPGVDYIKFLFPAIIAINVMTSSLATGSSIVWDREFGFLREILVAPVSRTGVVLGKVAGGSVLALGQAALLLVVAPFIGISLGPLLVLKLVPILVVLSLTLSCLGIFVGSLMRSQRAFGVVRQILELPLYFLTGAFFPVDTLPPWLEGLSKINPATYGVDAIRQLVLSSELTDAAVSGTDVSTIGVTLFNHRMSALEDALVVAAAGLVLLGAAVWSVNRQE